MADSNNTQDSAKPAPQSLALATGTMPAPCDRLIPATLKQGKSELGACLTLVAPSGLSGDDRREWLAVAMKTLSGIPADLLARGCEVARRTCRFPSEIVPTILEEIDQQWGWRKAAVARSAAPPKLVDPPEPEPDYVDPKEIRALIDKIGNANG